MKYIKLTAILMAAAMVMLPDPNCVYARGGGHFGGGRMGADGRADAAEVALSAGRNQWRRRR